MDKDPYIYRVKQVLKVVDGDTIDASIDLGVDGEYYWLIYDLLPSC